MKTFIAVAAFGLISQGVASAAPAWCKDAKFDEVSDVSDLKKTDPDQLDDVIKTVAKASCKPGGEIKGQAGAVESRRKQLSADLGMNDADWADVVAYANSDDPDPEMKIAGKDFGSMSAVDQFTVITKGLPVGNGDHFDDYNYLADVFEPNLSEAGRLAYIRKCVDGRGTQPWDDAVQFALCQADIDTLDVAKFGAQLRADTSHDGTQKTQVRVAMFKYKASEAAAHKKVVDSIFKKDAAYKKLFDNAKAGRDEWKTAFGGDTAGLALMQKMDSGFFFSSRKSFEGCEDTTGKALDAAIAKYAPVKTFKNLGDTRKDPYEGVTKVVGPALIAVPQIYFAAMPYAVCAPKTPRGDFFAYYIQERPGYRGSRAGALTKIWDNAVVLDDMKEKIEYPKMDRPYDRRGGEMGSAGGVVKSVKTENNMLVVELEYLPVKIDVCTKSHSTGRISRINWDSGVVEYGSVCDASTTKTINDQWEPFKINKKYAALIKKGVRISAIYGAAPEGAKVEGGDLIATWPNKTAPLPDTIMGVTVK